MPKRILIADDHAIVRDCLSLRLNRAFPDAILDEVDNGISALRKLKKNFYDIISWDIHMPETQPISGIKEVVQRSPNSKVIVFSMYPKALFEPRILRLGARAFVNKQSSIDELMRVFEEVAKKCPNKENYNDCLRTKRSEFDNLSDKEFEAMLMLYKI